MNIRPLQEEAHVRPKNVNNNKTFHRFQIMVLTFRHLCFKFLARHDYKTHRKLVVLMTIGRLVL